jgi:hypothetical protein
MLHPTHKIALVVIACGLLLFPNAMLGQKGKAREVQDEAKLFGDKAIEQTNGIIAKIKDKVKKDLVIETLDEGPDKAPAKWAEKRFAATGADGVYIVITKQPRIFEIVVGKKTRDKGYFTIANRDEIKSILNKNLKDKRDEALVKVAQYTLEAMSENAKKYATKLVKDEAKLFGEKAVKDANAIVAKIRETHETDLFIETLEKGPEDRKEFPAWTRDRYNKIGVDGVYIVITKEPKHFEYYVGDKTRESGLFTKSDRDEMGKMLRSLGDDRDDTLLKVATFVQETMDLRKKDDK